MDFGGLTGPVIGAAIKVHNRLGPGLLESAYKACLGYEFCRSGLKFEAEKALPLVYDGIRLDCGYRADFIIERALIVEVKCVTALAPVFEAQLLSYMKLQAALPGC